MAPPNFSDDSTSAKPHKLLDQVRDELRVRHYSIRTEQTYTGWIKRFILFHGKRRPKDMGAEDVEAFLTHLAVAKLYNRLSAEEAGTPASRTVATKATVRFVFCLARKNQADADLPDDGERSFDHFCLHSKNIMER